MSSFGWYNGSLLSEKILLNYYCVVTRLKMRKWMHDAVVNERVKKKIVQKNERKKMKWIQRWGWEEEMDKKVEEGQGKVTKMVKKERKVEGNGRKVNMKKSKKKNRKKYEENKPTLFRGWVKS